MPIVVCIRLEMDHINTHQHVNSVHRILFTLLPKWCRCCMQELTIATSQGHDILVSYIVSIFKTEPSVQRLHGRNHLRQFVPTHNQKITFSNMMINAHNISLVSFAWSHSSDLMSDLANVGMPPKALRTKLRYLWHYWSTFARINVMCNRSPAEIITPRRIACHS